MMKQRTRNRNEREKEQHLQIPFALSFVKRAITQRESSIDEKRRDKELAINKYFPKSKVCIMTRYHTSS